MSFDGRLRSGMMYYYFDVASYALISRLIMKDSVDGGALKRAFDDTLRCHPHITKGLREKNGNFYLADLDTPVPVLNTEEDLVLGGSKAGGHLYGITWHDDRINLFFYHGLMDGMAAQRVMETLLYYYCSYKNNATYDPDGIWIDDGTGRATYDSEPFENEYVSAEDEEDCMPRIPEECLHLVQLDAGWDKNEHTGFEVSVDSKAFMGLVKREEITPVSAAAVFLSHAAMRLYPDNKKPVKTAIPVDIRKATGLTDTFKNSTLDIGLYFDPEKMSALSIGEQGKVIRAQLKAQTGIAHLKALANLSIERMKQFEKAAGYEERLEMFRQFKRSSVDTFFLSYVGRLHLPGYEDEVKSVSLVSHSRNSIIINLTEAKDDFIFGFRQCVSSPFLADEFCKVLNENGIPAKRSAGESYTLPYVEFRETLGLK